MNFYCFTIKLSSNSFTLDNYLRILHRLHLCTTFWAKVSIIV